MTTPLEQELEHLVNLMAPPYREQWKAFCWAKAVYLSEHNPKDYASLPERLKAAMKSGSPESSDAGQK